MHFFFYPSILAVCTQAINKVGEMRKTQNVFLVDVDEDFLSIQL
jgi:hypothetical protein